MKLFILTLDTEDFGRNVTSHFSRYEAMQEAWHTIESGALRQGIGDIPPINADNGIQAAWDHVFPEICDQYTIDELQVHDVLGSTCVTETVFSELEDHIKTARTHLGFLMDNCPTVEIEPESDWEQMRLGIDACEAALKIMGKLHTPTPKPIQRIAITVNGGVADVMDAENWPTGLELYIADYDVDPGDGDSAIRTHLNGPCTLSKFTDDRAQEDGVTGYFAKDCATAWSIEVEGA